MTARSPDLDPQTVVRLKQEAAERAVDFIQSGMVVGLGTGSTTIFAVRRIGHRLADRSLRDVIGVPTSAATEAEARSLGIPLLTNDLPREVDLTIDGADEVDPRLDLIKGGGGALLREKIVAQASRREIIVVDQTKLSDRLGTRYRLPVEVLPFGSSAQQRYLEQLGARVTLRLGADDRPFWTDSGNLILDCDFGPIGDPAALAEHLGGRAGIVEHGLFIGIATDLIVARGNGIEHRQRDPSPRPA